MGSVTTLRLHDSQRIFKMLASCNRAIMRSACEEDLFTEVCRLTVEEGGYRMAWVGMINNACESRTIYPVAFAGHDGGYLAHINVSWDNSDRGDGPSGKCIKSGSTIVVQNILTDPLLGLWRDNALRCGFGSTIALPITQHESNQVLGVMRVYASEPDAFNAREVELLKELVFDVSFGIHIKRSAERLKIVEDLLRSSEEALRKIAFVDSLTGLPNRKLFEDRLQQALASDRRSGHSTCVLFLDLNRFKDINDTCGHAAGDSALVEVGKRFQSVLRISDTVSRFGGDEFAFVLSATDEAGAVSVAGKILDSLVAPVVLAEGSFYVGGSIGIAISPDNSETPSELISMADMAMYKSKSAGGGYCFYETCMVDNLNREVETLNGLRNAILRNELDVFYEPIVHIGSGQIVSAEVLLRWFKDGELFSAPDIFVPIAERGGLMVEIGSIVIQKAFRDYREWKKTGMVTPLSINISPKQITSEKFFDFVVSESADYGINPSDIEFELTENALISNMELVLSTLIKLKEHGFSIALDDFGVGQSSLSLLPQLPISTIKIDRAFVSEMLTDSYSFAVIENILATAKKINARVVAEGIESAAQANTLHKLGCEIGQGYLFGRASSISHFSGLWRANAAGGL